MNSIFIGALLFSIWSVVLFWGKNIGLSMLLFVVPFTYFLINILERKNKIKYKKAKVLIIPITLLSSTYFIFNNTFFNSLNIFIIPILILFMIIELIEKELELNLFLARIVELIFNPISNFGLTMSKLKEYIKLKFHLKNEKEKIDNNIIRGLLITIPVVIFIIILLSSADEVFGNIFVNIFKSILNITGKIKVSNVATKIIVTALVFCYLIVFFDYIASYYEADEEANNKELKAKSQDSTTMKMILVTLNIVYILFCIIQIKSLFMKSGVINYSQYARQGFFQLMLVSFINLVMILIAKRNENNKFNEFINIMCLIMIACTFIILISSAYRMHLYESAYGYTLLRLLVYVTLFTESILLIPTIIYVIDKPINLRKIYFCIIITIYVCINFANIDNIIARKNVDRYFATGKIDMHYLKNETGTDAMNQIIRIREAEAKTDEEKEVQSDAREYLSNLYSEIRKEKMDFRNFNISKIIAKKIF